MSEMPPLSGEALAALERARQLAVGRGASAAAPPDILLALLEPGSASVRVLEMFDVPLDNLRRGIEFLAGRGAWMLDSDPESRTVELARLEADRLGHAEAGPEHLLVALNAQSSVASGILESLGVTLDGSRDAIRFIHGDATEWERPTVPTTSSASASAPMFVVSPDDPRFAELGQRIADAQAQFDLSMSRLERVVGIGQGVDASGVLVELIALEIRADGSILHWRTQTADDRLLGPATVEISDDTGRRYQTLPGSWGGGAREARGETRITPHLPTDARTLIVEVASFGLGAFSGLGQSEPPPDVSAEELPASWSIPFGEAVGPWRFEVPLRD